MPLTSADLHELWEPHAERLKAKTGRHPTDLRLYRANSWLSAAEQQPDDDTRLMFFWISLNALYGRWDSQDGSSKPDRKSLGTFIKKLWSSAGDDGRAALIKVLTNRQPQVLDILGNRFLEGCFWKDPSIQAADKSTQASRTRTAGLRRRQLTYACLDFTLHYIYFLRCQIVHGGATHESSYNRIAVEPAVVFLAEVVPVIHEVMINHGADLDWGEACYAPVDE